MDIKQKLLDACVGHPNAKIPWPHRLLYEAIDEIGLLQSKLDCAIAALKYCAEDDPLAVTPDNTFDVSSTNEWKKMRAIDFLLALNCKSNWN